MKRCIAMVLVLMLILSGCGTDATVSHEKYEIVVVPAAWSDEVDAQIRDYVAEREQLNVYQNTSQAPDGLYQSLLVEDLIAQGVDAICLEVVDAQLAEPMIEKARQAGIVVLTGSDFCQMIDSAEKELMRS